ncbi:MAG: TraR/DksA family transcriptional regulator [Phycisphaerae bacterium]
MAKRKVKSTRKKAKSAGRPSAAVKKASAKAKRKPAQAASSRGARKDSRTSTPKAAKRKSVTKAAKKATAKIVGKTTAKASKKTSKKTVREAAAAESPAKRKAATTARAEVVERSQELGSSVGWESEVLETADINAKVPKTKLTKKQLREFEGKLLEKRRELVGDMENLTNEALSGNEASGNRSSAPFHMADVGSDNWEQEFTIGLIENERLLVREVDGALQRIEDRTYGVCLATHRPIDVARLRAKPWAKYCIEYARLRELRRVR